MEGFYLNEDKEFKIVFNVIINFIFFFLVLGNVSATDVDSFAELNQEIQAGNNITLKQDITITNIDIKDIGDNKGIIIKTHVTIDGHGHYINANHKTRFFQIKDGGSLNLINITLKNGQADHGGAIYCYNGNLKVINSNFYNNQAKETGGAISTSHGKDFDVINSTFNNNTAREGGGAISNNKNNFKVINSIFTNNKNNNYKPIIQLPGQGGAIINYDANCTIINSIFLNNKAKEDGGAICNMGKNLNILGSVFVNNYASGAKTYYCEGGAIFSGHGMNCIDSFFMNNHAEDGGAIYCKATLNLKNNTFINNRAEKAVHACEGGAVKCDRMGECCNCTFIGNRADDGGAIAIMQKAGKNVIQDCIFKDNKATGHGANGKGGAIFVNKIKAHISLIHNQFINNTAANKGDNVYNWGHYDTIEYNYFPNEKQNTFREYKVFHDKYHKDNYPYYNLNDYYNNKYS